jgi:hypothetical protein
LRSFNPRALLRVKLEIAHRLIIRPGYDHRLEKIAQSVGHFSGLLYGPPIMSL